MVDWLCCGTLDITCSETGEREACEICGCFSGRAKQVGHMSLNRCEQRVFDYVNKHQDERQHWQGKFHRVAKEHASEYVAVEKLEIELWRYYIERSEVVSEIKQAVASEGVRRTSMKNLAELLMRLWVAPHPKRTPTEKLPENLRT